MIQIDERTTAREVSVLTGIPVGEVANAFGKLRALGYIASISLRDHVVMTNRGRRAVEAEA
ncbi:hypothetical protein [Tsukamurella pulmonis]|uniref:hypothetical protein n=1 Tax=Tsukamurella pulmonis TaxID=47312 RepID=UPI0011119A58|nr:hypothetical protein [Tsukamurella pulmonis]